MNSNITCIPIFKDGAIASTETANCRLIPILILDCENHKELFNLIHIHQNTPPGDVVSKWGVKRLNSRHVYLDLTFLKPVEYYAVFKFDLRKQSALADGIVQARGVYLQPRESGEKVLDGINEPKILIEIPPGTTLKDWDTRLAKNIVKNLKNEGLSKKESKAVAKEYLRRTREIWGIRG